MEEGEGIKRIEEVRGGEEPEHKQWGPRLCFCPVTLGGDRTLKQPFSSGKWRQNHLLREGEELVGRSGGEGTVRKSAMSRRMEVAGLSLGRVVHVRAQALSWAGERVRAHTRSW